METTTATPRAVSREFDYARAWRELAYPAFKALEPEARSLFLRVVLECGELRQDSTLDTCWPEDPSLHDAFLALPSATLARAARVIYFLGQWRPGGESLGEFEDAHGAHWKFASYCDQILYKRLGLNGRGYEHGPRELHWEIHEGMLRRCAAGRHFWTWREVCLATEENLKRADERHGGDVLRAKSDKKEYENAERHLQALTSDHTLPGDFERRWLDPDRFMAEVEKCAGCFSSKPSASMLDGRKVHTGERARYCAPCFEKREGDAERHPHICDVCGHGWEGRSPPLEKHGNLCSVLCAVSWYEAQDAQAKDRNK